MFFCNVVSDSTDLKTDHFNLHFIIDINDWFEFIQISSNVSWINISANISSLDVASLWDLYFFFEILQIIAKYINIYINQSHRWEKEKNFKVKSFLNTDELKLKTYFEIHIYMNLHRESQVSNYWNMKLNKSLHSLIQEAIILNRYKDIDWNLYFFNYKLKFRSDNAIFQKVSVFLI